MNPQYEVWRELALCGTYTPLPRERLAEMHAASRYRDDSDLCEMVRELLREVEWLKSLGGPTD
jgi:hypothetical protein